MDTHSQYRYQKYYLGLLRKNSSILAFIYMLFSQIAEPVRFVVETKVRIYPATERFWYYTKRTVVRRYRLVVRRMEDGGDGLQLVEVVAGEEVAQPQQVYCNIL